MKIFNNTLTPAYGRDYSSAAGVKADIAKGRDFTIQPSGQYVNAEQLIGEGYTHCRVRYHGLRRIALFPLEKE